MVSLLAVFASALPLEMTHIPPLSVLAGDGVFATARKLPALPTPLDRLTRTPWGSPLADPRPVRQEFWGTPSFGLELDFAAASPFRDVWADLGPLRPFPADPFPCVGWIGGQ
jgi:hypothetical protein